MTVRITNNFCDSGSYFLCLHYISTSFFLLMDTCVRDTMARMIKNTTAFVCPSAYWLLLIAVLYVQSQKLCGLYRFSRQDTAGRSVGDRQV